MKPTSLECIIDWQLIIQAAGMLVTILVAYLVYLFAQRNMKYETKERLSRFKKEKLLEAGMGFWSLLAYTTLTENPLCIVCWERQKNSTTTNYFINMDNAKSFNTMLNKINYEKGYGMFLSNKARALFYEYRNILYGFLLVNKDRQEKEILVENEEMIQRMKQLHEEAIKILRQEMELEMPSMK